MEFLKIVCKYRTGPVNHADVMQAEEGEGRKVIEGAKRAKSRNQQATGSVIAQCISEW